VNDGNDAVPDWQTRRGMRPLGAEPFGPTGPDAATTNARARDFRLDVRR
jgi:hypothetical protein